MYFILFILLVVKLDGQYTLLVVTKSLTNCNKSAKVIFSPARARYVVFCLTFNQSIYLILIRVYPRKWGWPDLPHYGINLSNSHSPSRSIHGTFFSKPTLLLSFSTCVCHVFFKTQL